MSKAAHINVPFMKMHGLGNDFVVIDERKTGPVVTSALACAMGNRHLGIGFDQLAVIRHDESADIALLFWNADGSMAAACGNATRCVAQYEMTQRSADQLTIRTERGVLNALRTYDSQVTVNMGQPFIDWQDIPLAYEADTLQLPIQGAPIATGMGNPHCTFFVPDVTSIHLEEFGPGIEHHPLFPERTNVQVAQLIDTDHLRVRVWERGVGITMASGSSSCAVTVAAVRRGMTSHKVRISLDGGDIRVDWRDDGLYMSGPTAHVFDGVWKGIS